MVGSASCVQVFERVFNKFAAYVQGLDIPKVGSVQKNTEELLSICEEKLCYVAVTQSDYRYIENWLVDSGVSAHMTPYKRDLRDISSCSVMILLADGSELQCTEQGTCMMSLLPRVLLIPHLDRRLFSVPSFTSVNNNTVTFSHEIGTT